MKWGQGGGFETYKLLILEYPKLAHKAPRNRNTHPLYINTVRIVYLINIHHKRYNSFITLLLSRPHFSPERASLLQNDYLLPPIPSHMGHLPCRVISDGACISDEANFHSNSKLPPYPFLEAVFCLKSP